MSGSMRRQRQAHVHVVLQLLSVLSLSLVASVVSSDNVGYKYGHFEEIRLDPTSRVERHGNLDVVYPLVDEEHTEESFPLCHVATFLGFSRAQGGCDVPQATKIYKELVGIEMAIHHFNNGLGTVVPDLQDIHQRCPLKMSAEFFDSQYTPPVVVKQLTQILVKEPNNSNSNSENNSTTSSIQPCAVIAARTSSSTGPSAIVSGAYGLPQMSFTATSPELNDRFKYPMFSRVVPADDAAAKAAMRFLKQVVHSTHVNVVYVNDAFGNYYHQGFQKEAEKYNITSIGFPVAFPPDPNDIRQQLTKLKHNGVRHVLMVFFSSHLDLVLREAARLDIDGEDYFWMLGISTSYFNDLTLDMTNETDAALAHAIQGLAMLPEFGAKPDSPGYERFVQAWKSLDDNVNSEPDDTYQHLNRKIPTIRGVPDCFQAQPGFFETDPGSTAHFAYDTIISMGLGACANLADNSNIDLDGASHKEAIVNASFEGASGTVQLDPDTQSRDPLRFSYAVLSVLSQLNGNQMTFQTPETIVISPNEELTDWELSYLDSDKTFVFHDGSSNPPPSLPLIVVEYNYIGELRILGYTSFALIALLSVGFSIWTFWNRKLAVVRASQPFYLVMVCAGTLILGATLIPLSFDDEYYDQSATDAACMAQPWVATIGFVTAFSALASKMRRIDQLHRSAMRFRRLVLKREDVLVPLLVLLTLNVAVLLCWTIMAPLKFVRTPDEGTDLWNRLVSSTGSCRVPNDKGGAIPFILILAAINVAAVLHANLVAYRTRHVHIQYSESRWIGLIMLCLLQSWLTGIPIIGLLYDMPRAHYVVITLIVSLTSLVILLLIFVPKIKYTLKWQQWQKDSETSKVPGQEGLGSKIDDDDDEMADEAGEEGLKVYRSSGSNPRESHRASFLSSRTHSHRSSALSNRSHPSSHRLGSIQDLQQYFERSDPTSSVPNVTNTNDHGSEEKTSSGGASHPKLDVESAPAG